MGLLIGVHNEEDMHQWSRAALDARDDGITHINVYSKGKTSLGRMLSNFTETPFECKDGWFASIEGYWYWLNCHPVEEREQLRHLSGYAAKKLGRELRSLDWNEKDESFKLNICAAMLYKLAYNVSILKELKQSALPLAHYYIFGGKVVEPQEGKWILDMWEFIRKSL